VGNTIANFFLVAMVVLTLFELVSDRAIQFWALFAVVLFVYYLFLDLLPKTLFRLYPNRMCLMMVLPFRWLERLHRPVVAPMTWLAHRLAPHAGRGRNFFGNREELRSLVEGQHNPLTREERTLVNRVLNSQKLTVQRVAVSWDKVTRVTVDTPARAARRILADRGCSRMPVTASDGRKVVGLITIKSLLYRERILPAETVEEFMTPALFFEPDTRLEVALREFQAGGQRQAIVVDSGGHPVGIVSLTDVLRATFGEVTW